MLRLPLPTHFLMMAPNNRVGRHLVALIVALWMGDVCAGQPFPYVAYVVESEAYLRSGPGQRHYPTQQLPQGFALEVYRHDGESWCAVRPPEGSFSWIAAHQVRMVDVGIAEVIAERAMARVGSALSPVRSAVQVVFQRGERLVVLGADSPENPQWLRIVAPAGEFRWMDAQGLSRQPPIETIPPSEWRAQKSNFSTQPSSLDVHTTTEKNSASFGHLREARVEPGQAFSSMATSETAGFVPPTGPWQRTNPRTPTGDTLSLDVIAGSPAEYQLAQFQSQADTSPPPAPLNRSPLPSLVGPTPAETMLPNTSPSPTTSQPRIHFRGMTAAAQGPMAPRVQELQVRLSQTVVRPSSEWNFDQLQAEATTLLNQEKLSQVRAQLREVLDRIARFEQLRLRQADAQFARTDGLSPVGSLDTNGSQPLTKESVRQRALQDLKGTVDSKRTAASSQAEQKALYDAVGLLKPVVSRSEDAPEYALVNDRGDVVSFVTPTPELNLNPYLGQRIGVHGKRGFMPEYRRAHVTAGRVSPIEKSILR